MVRKTIIFLMLFFLVSGHVSASNTERLANDLSSLTVRIDQETDRLKKADLVIEENKKAKLLRAYQIAEGVTVNQTGFKNRLINLSYDETSDKPAVLQVGETWINNSIYAFGGGRNDHDIKRGFFDCSSFVHWAYNQIGISLGDRTSVTTDTLKKLGRQININNILPGDLVFFDTYKTDGHVGIYAGNGQFLGSQSSTGVAYADMTAGYWLNKFNGRVVRLD